MPDHRPDVPEGVEVTYWHRGVGYVKVADLPAIRRQERERLETALLGEESLEAMRVALVGPPCWWHELEHRTERGRQQERESLRHGALAALDAAKGEDDDR
jgi:hypothetical protein